MLASLSRTKRLSQVNWVAMHSVIHNYNTKCKRFIFHLWFIDRDLARKRLVDKLVYSRSQFDDGERGRIRREDSS